MGYIEAGAVVLLVVVLLLWLSWIACRGGRTSFTRVMIRGTLRARACPRPSPPTTPPRPRSHWPATPNL
jgi:hypothetical protein